MRITSKCARGFFNILVLRSFDPQPESESPCGLPPIFHNVLRVPGDFSILAMAGTSRKWQQDLPRVPLTTEEPRAILKTQQEGNEILTLRLVTPVGPDSGRILTKLALSHEIVRATTPLLRENRPAQVNLASSFPILFPRNSLAERASQSTSWSRVLAGGLFRPDSGALLHCPRRQKRG